MNWASCYIEKLQQGETVSFRPKGNSMTPLIKSGQLVTVSPDISELNVGDFVLCKVHANVYLHLISAIKQNKYQISNNHGFVNGWASAIYGKCIKIED